MVLLVIDLTSIAVSVLMRKVKIAASKLGVDDVSEWVEDELNGYRKTQPEYRLLRGISQAHNPYNGWIPVQGNATIINQISRVSVTESVKSLETLVEGGNGEIYDPLPPEIMEKLLEMTRNPVMQIGIFVQRSRMVSILDTLRNMILDCALNLSEAE